MFKCLLLIGGSVFSLYGLHQMGFLPQTEKHAALPQNYAVAAVKNTTPQHTRFTDRISAKRQAEKAHTF